MAIPQGLIFMALDKRYGGEAIDVGMVEAAVFGIIFLYHAVFVTSDRCSWRTILMASLVLFGLALFSNVHNQAHSWVRWSLLLTSALFSGAGLVVTDWMKWPEELGPLDLTEDPQKPGSIIRR